MGRGFQRRSAALRPRLAPGASGRATRPGRCAAAPRSSRSGLIGGVCPVFGLSKTDRGDSWAPRYAWSRGPRPSRAGDLPGRGPGAQGPPRLLSSPACGLLARQESAGRSSSAVGFGPPGAPPVPALAGDPREGRDGRGPSDEEPAMTTNSLPFLDPDPESEPETHAQSATASLLDELTLYFYRPGQDEPDPCPSPRQCGANSPASSTPSPPCWPTPDSRTISPTCCGHSSPSSTARSTGSSAISTPMNRRRTAPGWNRTARRCARSNWSG
ncbi:hypothetical protein PHAMO_470068 [Magnetospirillum molischianum DSM 120]|uniref:Uncharacterized protein n=1 Tax=Magnetospirillum molischianum DSM 120 TaxID=1150626 RepID=H8FWS9_MAGML|nr:hypothetical protein PHAMO_470068 [Magnetospirillum molischianum DSM 120]